MKIKKVVCVAATLATVGVTVTGYSLAKENQRRSTNEGNFREIAEEVIMTNENEASKIVEKNIKTNESQIAEKNMKTNESQIAEKNMKTNENKIIEKNMEASESKENKITEEKKTDKTKTDNNLVQEINEKNDEDDTDEFKTCLDNLRAIGYKTVQSKDIIEKNSHYLRIMATDVDDNIVWQVDTQKESTNKEYPSVEYLKTEHDYVIINDAGVLKALNIDTGKIIWKDEQYKKGGNSATVDWSCNTYVYSAEANKVTIYNKNGKVINVFDINKEECKFPSCIATLGDIALYDNHIYITRRNTNNEDYDKATEEYVEEIDINLSTNKVEISQFCNQFNK